MRKNRLHLALLIFVLFIAEPMILQNNIVLLDYSNYLDDPCDALGDYSGYINYYYNDTDGTYEYATLASATLTANNTIQGTINAADQDVDKKTVLEIKWPKAGNKNVTAFDKDTEDYIAYIRVLLTGTDVIDGKPFRITMGWQSTAFQQVLIPDSIIYSGVTYVFTISSTARVFIDEYTTSLLLEDLRLAITEVDTDEFTSGNVIKITVDLLSAVDTTQLDSMLAYIGFCNIGAMLLMTRSFSVTRNHGYRRRWSRPRFRRFYKSWRGRYGRWRYRRRHRRYRRRY